MPRRGVAEARFIDSHVHLGDYADPLALLNLAQSAGWFLFAAGIDEVSSRRALALSSSHADCVRAFVGVHPSEAERERDTAWLEGALGGASGIGEVGLDPKYSDMGPGSAQEEVFEMQLRLAERTGKPIQIHSRGAETRCLDILSTFEVRSVLLHWFQGEGLAARASDRGYFVSFGPAILVSRKIQRVCSAWDWGHVLAESDGPVGFRALGGAGGPWLVPSVAFKIGETRGVAFEETRESICRNSLAFLGEKS